MRESHSIFSHIVSGFRNRQSDVIPDRGQQGQSRFLTTHWSVVLRAGGSDDDETRRALAELVETYWYPLYAFSRRKGNKDHDAMDLTQGFFAHLLSHDAMESVAPSKGRFRSFLLAAFKNFMANERRAAATIRRGGAVKTFSLTDVDFRKRYDCEPANEESPDQLYERSWVESLLQRVRHRLADEYQRADKANLFELLEPHLTHRGEALPRAEICKKMNLSAAALAMSLHRMRRRYGELLREEVAVTAGNADDVEDELQVLMSIVSRPS